MTATALKVLVVDDSAVVRQTLTAILEQERGIAVVVAADPIIARGKIVKERPDVIVLDLEMPRMDGLTFLRELMAVDPIPVVICSGLTVAGAELFTGCELRQQLLTECLLVATNFSQGSQLHM